MTLFEIGRLVVKLAGRDAGKTAVIVDLLDDTYVLIDGQTRRKKVNRKHLEPLPKSIKIKKAASHQEVQAEFKKLGLETLETKPKQTPARPKKQKIEKLKAKKEEKKKQLEQEKAEKKKPAQKEEPKEKTFEEVVEKEVKEEKKE